MKTALVLTGHMRCFRDCFPNTKQYILDRFNPDVYISTWDNEGYWVSPEHDPEGLGVNKYSPLLNVNEVIDLYEPSVINVYRQEDYTEIFEKKGKMVQHLAKEIRAKNIVSQFWLMRQGINLLHPWESYDLVIRMRPDLLFHEELPDLTQAPINVINHPNHEGNGYGDMFFAGREGTVANLCYELWNYEYYLPEIDNRFCPHLLVKHIISNTRHNVLNIPKTLQHTPNGQYKDYIP